LNQNNSLSSSFNDLLLTMRQKVRGQQIYLRLSSLYQNMPKERKRKKATGSKELSVEEYVKQLPPPPEEHAHELKMEKRLKRLIEEQEKKR